MIDDHSEGSIMGKCFVPDLEEGYPSPSRQGPSQGFTFRVVSAAIADHSPPCTTVDQATIHVLPDNVLLEIFYFYKDDPPNRINFTRRWNTLTKVCRRWRHVVFGSPRRLDLRLACTSTTPTSRLLHIWPPLPIVLLLPPPFPVVDKNGMENLIAALECHDRISEIHIFDIRGPVLEKLVTALHEPLTVLKHFSLSSDDELVPVLPETFLGGFAPRLRTFGLNGIPFPSFPEFVLCFPHIVHLCLEEIPNSGYISPEVMATCMMALPHLEFLSIGFRSLPPRLLQSSPPRFTRAALPALSNLTFTGVCEYFEDFVARIDTPRLTHLGMVFFMDLIFDIPHLSNFIDRTERLKPFKQAKIEFSGRTIKIILGFRTRLMLEIRCERPDWQLSSMTQIFSQQLPLLSHVEQLEICELPWRIPEWKDDPDMDPSQWLELFRLFVAAQSLHVSGRPVSPVVRALKDLTGQTATEVLPVLRTLFLEELKTSGPVYEAMKSFTTARQLSHHPVVIQRWDRFKPRF